MSMEDHEETLLILFSKSCSSVIMEYLPGIKI